RRCSNRLNHLTCSHSLLLALCLQVKWSRENYHHSLSSPYSLRLASADSAGKIIVWDVVSGTAHCEIQEHSKPIQDMDWLWTQDASRDLLLAIHPPNYIVLWNGDTGTKLWKKSYAENILSFSFDPFDPSNLACKQQSPTYSAMFYRSLLSGLAFSHSFILCQSLFSQSLQLLILTAFFRMPQTIGKGIHQRK
ncbi:unnamed protein product, partial [Oncorhynchus mykiss]